METTVKKPGSSLRGVKQRSNLMVYPYIKDCRATLAMTQNTKFSLTKVAMIRGWLQ